MKYQHLSKEEKETKQQYGREPYKNFLKDEQKILELQKKILQNKENRFIIIIRKYFNLKKFASSQGKV